MIKSYSKFKIFESHQSYYEINSEEFLYLKFSKSIDIENRYINFLTNLNNYISMVLHSEANPRFISIEQTTLSGYSVEHSVEHSIYQLEDDYFLIATFCSKDMSSFRNIKILGSENFYKCDQIEGLRDFLENFIEKDR